MQQDRVPHFRYSVSTKDFLLNPQVRTHSRTDRETPRHTGMEKQEPNVDRSQKDPHHEVGSSVYQPHHSGESDPEEAPHRISGIQLFKKQIQGSANCGKLSNRSKFPEKQNACAVKCLHPD